jgi:hypothetical protein
MRWFNPRSIMTLSVLTVFMMFLAVACTGEEGSRGIQGDQGPQGDRGASGPQGDSGDAGYRGNRGLRGERGPEGKVGIVGPAGPQGNEGPTQPIGIIVLATGTDSGSQPTIVAVGAGQPKLTLIGSGFTPGEFITVELVVNGTTTYVMEHAGGSKSVSGAGTFSKSAAPPRGLPAAIPAGLYTVRVTAGPSLTTISAPLSMVEAK